MSTPKTDAAVFRDMQNREVVIADFARRLEQRAKRAEARLHWLHDCSNGTTDSEGYEWGIYRVKWVNGQATEVLATLSDFSDLDAEMKREADRARAS